VVTTRVLVSMLMPVTVTPALLPALSMAVPVTLWLAPLPVSVTSGWQPAMPDPGVPAAMAGSLQVKCTVTGPLYQPPAFGAVVGAPVIVGAVLSILTWRLLATSPLPALSTLQYSTV